MKYSDILFFIKYPYASGIIAVIWIASAIMVMRSDSLELLPVLAINMVVTWVLSWLSYRG